MIADFHNDYLTANNACNIIKQYNEADNLVVGAVFRGNRDFICAKSLCRIYGKFCGSNQVIAFEDFGYDVDLPILFHGLLGVNPLYVGLTWNGENNLAFGCFSDGKIKKRGATVIKELNRRKISVDTAHLCEKSFYGVIESADSVICSHSCFNDIRQHPRNLKYSQIREIIMKGGLIGLTLYVPFLGDNDTCDIEQVYRHIDYFCQSFNPRYLCFGTDFYGCDKFPLGFNDYYFENTLIDFLLSKGYSYDVISGILYKNLATFIQSKM